MNFNMSLNMNNDFYINDFDNFNNFLGKLIILYYFNLILNFNIIILFLNTIFLLNIIIFFLFKFYR